jgi:large subunit ribosomal protein L29
MKPEKLRQLKPDELDDRIVDLRDQLFNGAVKHSTGQLDNTASLQLTRRELARALTVRAERRQAE